MLLQQEIAFFENAEYIRLVCNTREPLVDKGIAHVDDLVDFNKETIDQIASNLCRATAVEGAALQPPFPFGAKVQKRLTEACELVRFYETIGRTMTLASLCYTVVKDFTHQWTALKNQKDKEQSDVPKISKESGVLFWTESFKDHLCRSIGVRMIPIVYVIRSEIAPDVTKLGARANQKPHASKTNLEGQEIGLIKKDLIKFAPHDHALYKEDSS